MKLLVVNGPNLNLLGQREPSLYGSGTLKDLEDMIRERCAATQTYVEFFQSNHEGALVDAIQQAYGRFDALLLNPAAYTHTSIAILDALKAVGLPAVEVHLTDIAAREPFRQHSYISPVCIKTIAGKGFAGYLEGIDALLEALSPPSAG